MTEIKIEESAEVKSPTPEVPTVTPPEGAPPAVTTPAQTPSQKILNNKYNTGTVEFEHFGEFVVSDTWVKTQSVSSHEGYEIEILNEDINTIFKNAPFFENYAENKKVKKDSILEVFWYFQEHLKEPERYTFIEKFLAIAGYMNINFKILYDVLDIKQKEKILNEFDDKYDIFKKKNIKKLF
jgi:hypothetical protein